MLNKYKIVFCMCILIAFNITCLLAEDIKITSPAAIVMEVSTGRVLYAKNIESERKIASTTKLMTAMVVIDNCSLSDKVEISKAASRDRWF